MQLARTARSFSRSAHNDAMMCVWDGIFERNAPCVLAKKRFERLTRRGGARKANTRERDGDDLHRMGVNIGQSSAYGYGTR